MSNYEDVILTFPDGRYVSPGEIDDWIAAVDADGKSSAEDKQLARDVAARIRQLSN